MTPAGEKIASMIRRCGPLRFAEFMETALYDAECGYYTSGRKVFGREGDFYTSEQIQPVFGRLVAAAAETWRQQCAGEFRLVEWGAGRGEMEEQLGRFNYAAVDRGRNSAPARFEGAVFSNELFDALAVDAAKRSQGLWRLMRVGLEDGQFVWMESEELEGEWLEYALRAGSFIEEDEALIELPVSLKQMLAEIGGRLVRGQIVAVDYGYTERELRRFPAGTLMAYRKHQASCEVLRNPGEQDITAHVPFTYLLESAAAMGWRDGRLRTLSQWIMEECGECGVEKAVEAESEAERVRLRLKLKTLLFGMGESFRVAEWNKLA
jgi:SAM-dependent MidA family methyltransferase